MSSPNHRVIPSSLSFSFESMTDALREKSIMDAEAAALKPIEGDCESLRMIGASLPRRRLLSPPYMTPRRHSRTIHSSAHVTTLPRRSLRVRALHSPPIASLLWCCCRRICIFRRQSSGQQPQKHASGTAWCETRAQWRHLRRRCPLAKRSIQS
jgi:hypothetical protein